MNWREVLVKLLGGEVRRSRTFVADVEWERSEELRPDRLGLTEDFIRQEDPNWKPPPDQWRPKNTLGPM